MIIILIAGASASGKTRLAGQLLTKLNECDGTNLLLKMDDYYREIPEGADIVAFRRDTNFDTPDMLELALLQEHLVALDKGENITKHIFDFNTNSRVGTEVISPPDVLIIEGIFALLLAKNLPDHLTTISAFVETNSYLSLLNRRIDRDIAERGCKDRKEVLKKEHKHVGHAFFSIISATRHKADIIVDNSEVFNASAAEGPHPLTRAVDEIYATLEAKRVGSAVTAVCS